jgi:putative acetyltransferase
MIPASAMTTLTQAASEQELALVRELFREYAADSELDLCFQNFAEELAGLPGAYAPPAGRLFLAYYDGQLAACGAVRPFDAGVCEMKRLFVRPAFRRHRIGRVLAERLVNEARTIGYRAMRLDTLGRMKPAIALYEALGFRRIEAYRHNPLEDVVYMEVSL